MSGETALMIPQDEWDEVRKRVAPFASRDKQREPLGRVHVRVRNRRREWFATDSYRLARWRSPHPATGFNGFMTVPHTEFTKRPGPVEITNEGDLEGRSPFVDGRADKYMRSDAEGVCLRVLSWGDAVDALTDTAKAATTAKLERNGFSVRYVIAAYDGRPSLYGISQTVKLIAPYGVVDHIRVECDDKRSVWTAVNPTYLRDLIKAAGQGCTVRLPADPLDPIKVTNGRFVGIVMPVRI